jgi:Transposase DDE domain group 1
VKSTSWSSGLSVAADGTGVVAHAGGVAVRLLADRVGLTEGLSTALTRRSFTPGHDRGRVLVDVATMLAGGGEAIADIDTLRHQGQVLGPVASAPTVWRALAELTPARLRKLDQARAVTRKGVWARLPDSRPPASTVAGVSLPDDLVVLDVDATIVVAHSEKENARATFKRTFGFHPIGVWCDNTTELLAMTLRPGNANANTTADHIEVLTAAIRQLPPGHRKRLLVRADGAGASHGLLDWLTGLDAKRGRSVDYSVGFPVTEPVRAAISLVPDHVWQVALDADGQVRQHADVAEITGLVDPSITARWPAGMRLIVRREHPHPGAALSLFEHRDGWRYQVVATNTAAGQLAFLEARHRAHARVEDRIRHAKDTGLARLPSREFAINQAWIACVTLAADLTAWLRLLALPESLKTCEPKALRYRLLHVPARVTRGARQRRLRFPRGWPWAADLLTTFTTVMALAPG